MDIDRHVSSRLSGCWTPSHLTLSSYIIVHHRTSSYIIVYHTHAPLWHKMLDLLIQEHVNISCVKDPRNHHAYVVDDINVMIMILLNCSEVDQILWLEIYCVFTVVCVLNNWYLLQIQRTWAGGLVDGCHIIHTYIWWESLLWRGRDYWSKS